MYLAALGDFELLNHLFGKIAIPQAGFDEVVLGGAGRPVAHSVKAAMASWLSVQGIANTSEADRLCKDGLHPGESEAIALAQELCSEALLMDDADGIRFALEAKANVIRTPGIYAWPSNEDSSRRFAPKSTNFAEPDSGCATNTTA